MLKEFAQYLVSLKDNKTYNIHGDTYSDHDLVRIKPHIDRPANLSVSGLDSIVKLVRNELDMFENLPVFIRVDDARTVSVFTTYDDVMCRDSLYTHTRPGRARSFAGTSGCASAARAAA